MSLKEILSQPEGRRLEFKEQLPKTSDLAMESHQSDAKNKTIAPVFKRLGIIDQWGNGLKMIGDELKEYPDIEFIWRETGLSFQVQFIKKDFVEEQELQQELQQELTQVSLYTDTLLLLEEKEELSSKKISESLGQRGDLWSTKQGYKKNCFLIV